MTSHPAFNQKPQYKTLLYPEKFALMAKHARQAGYYNLTTLWLFRKSWLHSQGIAEYLLYLSFRRDLGYQINNHQRQRLKCFFKSRLQFYFWCCLHLKSLLLYKKLLRSNKQIKTVNALQKQLQKVSSIQLVGNSGNLLGSKLGMAIDQAEIVVRFNSCFNQNAEFADTGQKIDIWVGAPDFKQPTPKASWYIISGPDMLSWIKNLPEAFQDKSPLLSMPLDCWRHLVKILAAPPSAGVLTAFWFKQLAPNSELWLCGFTFSPNNKQYHHADYQHKAVVRHNWHGEAKLLQEWKSKNIIKEGCRYH